MTRSKSNQKPCSRGSESINTASETESDLEFESDSLEDLGIKKLSELTGRRKQKLADHLIAANGFIEVEDDSVEDFDSINKEAIEEDDWHELKLQSQRTVEFGVHFVPH